MACGVRESDDDKEDRAQRIVGSNFVEMKGEQSKNKKIFCSDLWFVQLCRIIPTPLEVSDLL